MCIRDRIEGAPPAASRLSVAAVGAFVLSNGEGPTALNACFVDGFVEPLGYDKPAVESRFGCVVAEMLVDAGSAVCDDYFFARSGDAEGDHVLTVGLDVRVSEFPVDDEKWGVDQSGLVVGCGETGSENLGRVD